MCIGRIRPCFRSLAYLATRPLVLNCNSILPPFLRLWVRKSFYVKLCHHSYLKRTLGNYCINDEGILSKVGMVLQNTFQCSEQEANSIVQALRVEHLKDISYVTTTALLLRKNGLQKDSLISFPWILEYESNALSCAIPHLNKFHEDINVTVPLIKIPLNRLAKLSIVAELDKSTVRSRIKFVSEALQCEPLMVSISFAKYRFMLSLPLNRLIAVLEVLKEAEIGAEAVLKDMWIFQHNIELMKQRMRRAKEAGILPIRPWSLRCEENVFNRMLEKKVEVLKVLGQDTSLEDYLSRKLDCKLSEVSYVHSKTPHVARSSCPRINRLLDYLYSEGFTPGDVLRMPRVLTRSLKTVQSRMKELHEMGFKVRSLSVVCKTRREYKEFISKLKLNKFTEKTVSRRN